MQTIADLPIIKVPVPADLPRRNGWIDNGPLSNFARGDAVIRFRSVVADRVEPAYVAAKAPDALVAHPRGDAYPPMPFHERVALEAPTRVKRLGRPRAQGGLIDPRADWDEVCVGAMASFLAQKFAAGTTEAAWLATRMPESLVEFANWGDARWGCAFRNGGSVAAGRNALGLLLVIGRARLLAGRALPTADEAYWGALQVALLPVMARHSAALWGGQRGAARGLASAASRPQANPLTEKLRPHIDSLQQAAAAGDILAQRVELRDPGAPDLCTAAMDEWLARHPAADGTG